MPGVYHRFAVAVFILVFGFVYSSQAQHRAIQVTGHMGLIENLQDDAFGQPRYAFYPELRVSANPVHLEQARLALGGGIYWGYWTDGVRAASHCADCITYSHTSHIAGARASATLTALPLPVTFYGGLSRHFVHADYLGGAGISGNTGADYSTRFTAAEVGMRMHLPLSGRLRLGGDVRVYGQLPVDENNPHASRKAAGIELSYSL